MEWRDARDSKKIAEVLNCVKDPKVLKTMKDPKDRSAEVPGKTIFIIWKTVRMDHPVMVI